LTTLRSLLGTELPTLAASSAGSENNDFEVDGSAMDAPFPQASGGPRARNDYSTNSVVVQRQFLDASSAAFRIILRARTFFADGWPAFLVPNAFVEDLPNETTEPVGDSR
jgi:hypothetical protein